MRKKIPKELQQFLKAYSKERAEDFLQLRDIAWSLCPNASEIIYDNYNALAIGWTLTSRLSHSICSIALMRGKENIHFGFWWGNIIKDPDGLLLGKGNQYRYIQVPDIDQFPKQAIKKMIAQTHSYVLSCIGPKDELIKGQSIIKSVSDKKRTTASRTPRKSVTVRKKAGKKQ